MDKTNLIKQLKELSDGFGLGIPAEAIEKAVSISRFKIYSKGEVIARTGDKASTRYVEFRKRYPKLSERVPLRYIATYLGITPESLSRIRSAMKEDNSGE